MVLPSPPPSSSQDTSHAGHGTPPHSPPLQPKSMLCNRLRPIASCRVSPYGCNACAARHQDSKHHRFAVTCAEACRVGFDTLSSLAVWQHIPASPLHASSPVSAVPARPRRSDLGNVTLGCHSHLPCVCPGGGRPLPSTVHSTPFVTKSKQMWASAMTTGPLVPSN